MNNLKVKVKKTHPEAKIPKYARNGDGCFDLTAVSVEFDSNKGVQRYDTGLAFEIPEGYVGLVFPRSSISKTDLSLRNCVGVIDSGYRGSVKAEFSYLEKAGYQAYNAGERIVQMMIIPRPTVELEEVSTLNDTERGEGGYGSTGTL